MAGIIVVFPNRDNATNIRNLLARNGMDVAGVCTSGAQAMNCADAMDEGVVVCGYQLKDMMYTELREYLPEEFEMLLVASREKWEDGLAGGVAGLPMPLKAYDLVNAVSGMLEAQEQRRKKRKEEKKKRSARQQEVIAKAKELLMSKRHMTEEEAHRYLQKNSMDSGTNIVETAQMVLSLMAE